MWIRLCKHKVAAKRVIYLVFAADCFANYKSWPEILDCKMRRFAKSGDRQPHVKIRWNVGKIVPHDADKSRQNRDYTSKNLWLGRFCWWRLSGGCRGRGKTR